jgi:hypothetical protein
MTDAITKEDMEKLFDRYFGGGGGGSSGGASNPKIDIKNIEAFTKQIKESTEAMKKSLPLSKQFEDVLRGQTSQYKDITAELEDIDKKLEAFGKSVDSAAKLEQKQALEKEKSEKIQQANANNSRVAVQNFSVAVGNVAGSLIKSAFQFAKDLQSGASGVEAGTNAAASAARTAGDAASSIGKIFVGLSGVLGSLPGHYKYLGIAAAALGIGLDTVGTKAAEIAEEGIKFLGTELKNTQKAYKDVTETGAVLAGGMTELRQTSAKAGLDVSQMAAVVRSSKDDLIGMGLGLGEATKRIAGVSKELRNSDLGIQLRKLGYSAEEQASLAASVGARMSAAGDTRILSDKELAATAAKYGKDLKVLSNITGEDAKKAMEKARLQAQEQDLLAEALAQGGPEAVKKLEAQLATMPESMKKGYMEFVSTGGTAIADAATNVAITQNPKILNQYKQQFADLQNNQIDASAAMDRVNEANEQTYKYAKENAAAGKEIAQSARLTGNPLARSVADITNSLIVGASKQKEGASKAARIAVDGAAANMAPLDVQVTELEENTQKLKAALGEQLLTPITQFASVLSAGVGTVEESLAKVTAGLNAQSKAAADQLAALKEKQITAQDSKNWGKMGLLEKAESGAARTVEAAGSELNVFGVFDKVLGLMGTSLAQIKEERVAKETAYLAKKGYALGGIATGPVTGYMEKLHGTEAVVPLEGGRSIPVSLKMDDLLPKSMETLLSGFKQEPAKVESAADLVDTALTKQKTAFGWMNKDKLSQQSAPMPPSLKVEPLKVEPLKVEPVKSDLAKVAPADVELKKQKTAFWWMNKDKLQQPANIEPVRADDESIKIAAKLTESIPKSLSTMLSSFKQEPVTDESSKVASKLSESVPKSLLTAFSSFKQEPVQADDESSKVASKLSESIPKSLSTMLSSFNQEPVTDESSQLLAKLSESIPKSLSTMLSSFKQESVQVAPADVELKKQKTAFWWMNKDKLQQPTTVESAKVDSASSEKTYLALSKLTDMFPKSVTSVIGSVKDIMPAPNTADTAKVINSQLAIVPESMKKGFMEMLNTSGIDMLNSSKYAAVPPTESSRGQAETIDFAGLTNKISTAFELTSKQLEKSSNTFDTTIAKIESIPATKSAADSELSNLVKEQLNILLEIRRTLDSSRDLQQQYVNNSYS